MGNGIGDSHLGPTGGLGDFCYNAITLELVLVQYRFYTCFIKCKNVKYIYILMNNACYVTCIMFSIQFTRNGQFNNVFFVIFCIVRIAA